MRSYSNTRGLFKLCVVFLALTVAFCGCNSKDSPVSATGTWTIIGKTALIGAVNPLPGITVRCGGQSTTSGPDGSYELRGVPEGTHVISAEGPNCKPYSKSIKVTSDTRHFIYLDFNGTTISGYVSNFLDGPIQGATVKIGVLSDQTDQTGHYRITDVPLKSDSIIVTHSRYSSARFPITTAGPDTPVDFILQRDTVISGRITADQYVDETQANSVLLNTRLTVGTNGYVGAHYYSNIRRYIYINFDFPAFMKDPRVILLDGILELCTDGAYAPLDYDIFGLSAPWFYLSLTFNQQPNIGLPLRSVSAAAVAGPQYETILSSDALRQLLADYRSGGLLYGFVIQCRQGIALSRSFYSTRANIYRPRVTFKVRF